MNDSSEANQRILDGTTWREFCDTLKGAGDIILSEGTPATAFDRAEGFRYLSRILRAALQTFVEHADANAPVLQRVVHETAKMGADNPDNFYQNAAISGAHEYRIRGQRGSVHYLSFSTQKGHYGQGAGMPPTGQIEASELEIATDGSFELILSCDEQPGNWLPMQAETGTLIVRQTFLDRSRETLADLHIERIDGPTTPAPVTADAIDRGLTTSAALVNGAAGIFASWARNFQEHTNTLPLFDPEMARAFGGDPNIVYYHSYWKLGENEALVIDATPPACDYWNFQLNNHWMESLDYRYFPIHVNKHTATYRDDGSVRVVVAHKNPGVDNWIDTVGHDQGTMCWRWVRADSHPQPKCQVVALSEL